MSSDGIPDVFIVAFLVFSRTTPWQFIAAALQKPHRIFFFALLLFLPFL